MKNQSLYLYSPIKIPQQVISACIAFLHRRQCFFQREVRRVSCDASTFDSVISLIEALTGFSYGRGTYSMNTVFQVNGTTGSVNIFCCKRSKPRPTVQLLSSPSVVFHCDFVLFFSLHCGCTLICLVENINVFHLRMLFATDTCELNSTGAVNLTVCLVQVHYLIW